MIQNREYLKIVHAGESYLPDFSYNATPERLLFPIPNKEVLIGNLEQNPGY